jgi:branched-chain amino acid transport system permease protein
MGVDVGATKVVAFVVSAALAGVSGALYASYLSFAQPTQWNLNLSIQFIAAIIVGGMGTTAGPLLGSAVVFALPSLLKSLPFVPEDGTGGVSVGDLTSISYGVLIVAFLVLEPRGLVGLADRLRSVRRRSPAPDFPPAIVLNTPEEAHS